MMYIRWLVLVLACIGMSLVNYFLAPIVVLFASEDGWLPRWLWWFQTPDNSLDGDGGWKQEHRPFTVEQNRFQRWANRTGWLYRNAAYGFSIDVLGAKTLPGDALVVIGDPLTSNRPVHSGLVRRIVYRDGRPIYWQFYFVWRWSSTRCVRVLLGWKLWAFREGQADNIALAISINPFMGLSEPVVQPS